MDSERDKKVIEAAFHSAPSIFNSPWGWRIPQNPEREPSQMPRPRRMSPASHFPVCAGEAYPPCALPPR